MTSKKCIVKRPWKFLFWSGVSKDEEHDWSYVTTKRRICNRCNRREIYLGDTEYIEDWRQAV